MNAEGVAPRLAGYQGGASILTRALQHVGTLLDAGGGLRAGTRSCDIEADVTALGESARSLFNSVQAGRRQVCYLASGYLGAQVPELAVLDLPFRVRDRAAPLQALDGAAGQALTDAVAARTGLRVLGFWDNGFRHLTNRLRAVHTPADCAGLRVRTLDSADYRDTMTALGMQPHVTDVRELRSAVASGLVDAQENPLTNFVNFELWRHHPHVSLTGHLFGIVLLVAHGGWLDALPDGQRAVLHEAAVQATMLQRQWAAQEDDTALAFLRGAPVQVVPAGQVDIAAMRQCCAAMVAARLQRLPAALLQAYAPDGAVPCAAAGAQVRAGPVESQKGVR